jgi:hypothetical protein
MQLAQVDQRAVFLEQEVYYFITFLTAFTLGFLFDVVGLGVAVKLAFIVIKIAVIFPFIYLCDRTLPQIALVLIDIIHDELLDKLWLVSGS